MKIFLASSQMLNRKLCVTILFVASMLGTARGENVIEGTDDEEVHLATRKVKSDKPAISLVSNGSLFTPGKGIFD